MRFRHSLRFRVALAFALLGALVSMLFSVGLYFATQDLERRLIDDTLQAELEDYVSRRQRNPVSPPPNTKTIRGYIVPAGAAGDGLPGALRGLDVGWYELLLDGHPYRAVVDERGGSRFFILYDEEQLQRRQSRFLVTLVVGVLLTTVASGSVAMWLAGRAISPVSELARRVMGLDPEHRPDPLTPSFARDEVGALAAAFDQYLARLQAFIDRERAFTTDVSHELRTPVAVINGAVEVMLATDDLPESTGRRLKRVERAAAEMSELISALLALARERDAVRRDEEECDAGALLEAVVDGHRHLLEDKPVSLSVDIENTVRLPVQRALLRIVLSNLIANAFTYTQAGDVHLVLGETGFSVRDTGIGIDAEDLGHVFERHYRGRSGTGEGVGLSLVKRICEIQGWHIAIASDPGEGTRIDLHFS